MAQQLDAIPRRIHGVLMSQDLRIRGAPIADARLTPAIAGFCVARAARRGSPERWRAVIEANVAAERERSAVPGEPDAYDRGATGSHD